MKIIFLGLMLIASGTAFAQQPRLYLVSAEKAAAVKNAIPASKQRAQYIKELTKDADKLLTRQFGSVMDKKFVPPCGNMHEYMSMARYYWPDSSKPGGIPYIRKDGQKNPANDLVTDDKNFDVLVDAVQTLAWAWYFTNDQQYADKGIALTRFWFLDTATRMLPNLNHAQIRTGIDSGVSSGIIDSHGLPRVLDGIGLLRLSPAWKAADEEGMKQWFSSYLQWLLNSKNGKKEAQAKNNHGTFYDLQIVTVALFIGDTATADKMLHSAFARIAAQVEPDGKQPLELERTLALGYSTFNLDAWSQLANAAETRKIDLWNYQTEDGRSIRKAIDYLIPFATGEKKWEYQQIGNYKVQDFYRLLLIAAEKFNDEKYRQAASLIKDANKNIFVKIFYE